MDWHRESFRHQSASLERRRKEAAQLAVAIKLREQEVTFYAEQIAEADKRGLDGFDADRLMVKRKT